VDIDGEWDGVMIDTAFNKLTRLLDKVHGG
jgi:hypothetical protein